MHLITLKITVSNLYVQFSRKHDWKYKQIVIFIGRVLYMSSVDTKSSINFWLYGKLFVVQNEFCEAESTCNICFETNKPSTLSFWRSSRRRQRHWRFTAVFMFSQQNAAPLFIFLLYAWCLKFLGSRFHLNSLDQINTIYIYSTEKEIRCILSFSKLNVLV